MKPVENYKDVTINERKFQIRKFPAMTGTFMVMKIQKLLSPLVKNMDMKNLKKLDKIKKASDVDLGAFDFSSIMIELGNIPEDEFNHIQTNCLKVCYELLPSGPTKVLNDDGTFGVNDLEEDTMTVLALIIHTLIFNVKGFFQGSPLQKLIPGVSTTSQQG